MPGEYAATVDGKHWKKLFEMELKAFKMVEGLVFMISKACVNVRPSFSKPQAN